MNTTAAVAALEDARIARARMAQKVSCPPYMHALFGALYGVLVAAWAGPVQLLIGAEIGVVAVAAWMVFWARRRMGFFVNGYRKGRTRPVVAALLVLYFAAFSLAAWFKEERRLAWPALVLGALMFAVGMSASIVWQRVYRRELDPMLGMKA